MKKIQQEVMIQFKWQEINLNKKLKKTQKNEIKASEMVNKNYSTRNFPYLAILSDLAMHKHLLVLANYLPIRRFLSPLQDASPGLRMGE